MEINCFKLYFIRLHNHLLNDKRIKEIQPHKLTDVTSCCNATDQHQWESFYLLMSVNNENKGWYWHSPTDQCVLSHDTQRHILKFILDIFRIISLWGPFRGRYRSTCVVVSLTLSMRSCWTPNFPPYPCEALGMVSNSFCFRLVCSVDTVSRSRWMLCRGRTESGHTFKSFLRWI